MSSVSDQMKVACQVFNLEGFGGKVYIGQKVTHEKKEGMINFWRGAAAVWLSWGHFTGT